MTPEEAFAEVLAGVAANAHGYADVSDAQLRTWPSEAVVAMKSQGILRAARPATSVVCPGCEESCLMPVNTIHESGYDRASFVVCDKRDDINRVTLSADSIRQWRSDVEAVRRFVIETLRIRRTGEKSLDRGFALIGLVRGKRRTQMLAFRTSEPSSLVVGELTVPVPDLVTFSGGKFCLNTDEIQRLVDLSSTSDARHVPSTARRNARRLDTEALYLSWRKAYRVLKKQNPGQSNSWCAKKIAASTIGQGRGSETIRKRMMP